MSVSPHAYPSRVIARAGSRPSRPKVGAPAGPLGIALLCIFALAATWCAAALVPSVHLRDAYALFDFTQLQKRPDVVFAADALLDLLSPVTATLWACLLVAVALRRRLPRVALAVALVMGLAPLSADILKPLLAHSHAVVAEIHVNAASWPSGHATAALTLALCAVLVTPARLRAAVLSAGLLFAAAIGVALVILAWHMPSDVFGGYLLASLWMSLAVGALRACERRWPLPARS